MAGQISIFSYLNPLSTQFPHACKKFQEEPFSWRKAKTVFLTILAGIVLPFFGGVAVFRYFVFKDVKKIESDSTAHPTANKTSQIGNLHLKKKSKTISKEVNLKTDPSGPTVLDEELSKSRELDKSPTAWFEEILQQEKEENCSHRIKKYSNNMTLFCPALSQAATHEEVEEIVRFYGPETLDGPKKLQTPRRVVALLKQLIEDKKMDSNVKKIVLNKLANYIANQKETFLKACQKAFDEEEMLDYIQAWNHFPLIPTNYSAVLSNTRSSKKNTIFHIACKRKFERAIEKLLKNKNIDVCARNDNGELPLLLYCKGKGRKSSQELIFKIIEKIKIKTNGDVDFLKKELLEVKNVDYLRGILNFFKIKNLKYTIEESKNTSLFFALLERADGNAIGKIVINYRDENDYNISMAQQANNLIKDILNCDQCKKEETGPVIEKLKKIAES